MIRSLIYSLFILMFISCSNDVEETLLPGTDPLDLSGELETRAGNERKFSLYAFPAGSSGWNNFYINGANAQMGENGSISISPSYYWPVNNERLKFYGIMKGDNSYLTSTNGLITLEPGRGHAHDYLVSDNLIAGKSSSPKQMTFSHLMTRLIILVDYTGDPSYTITLTGNIEAGKDKANYDLRSQTRTITGTDYTLNFSATNREPGVYYLIPDEVTEIDRISNIRINQAEMGNVELTPYPGAPYLKLLPGKSYTIKLTVNNTTLNSFSWEVSEWEDAPPINADLDRTDFSIVFNDYKNDITGIEITDNDGKLYSSPVSKDSKGILRAGKLQQLPDFNNLREISLYMGDERCVVPLVNSLNSFKNYWTYDGGTKTLTLNPGDKMTSDFPYLIATEEKLRSINNEISPSGNYLQIADIDLGNREWIPIGTVSNVFSGIYDGGGYRIRNLKISGSNDNSGLFGYLNGKIQNVHIISGDVSGGNNVGTICGNFLGLIENCSSRCRVTGNENVGGICGLISGGISGCLNEGIVNAIQNVGGICGIANANIQNCASRAKVSGITNVAGICGIIQDSGVITHCYSTAMNYGDASVWGIVATTSGTVNISDCYFSGTEIQGSPVGTTYRFEDGKWPSWSLDQTTPWATMGSNVGGIYNYPRFKYENH